MLRSQYLQFLFVIIWLSVQCVLVSPLWLFFKICVWFLPAAHSWRKELPNGKFYALPYFSHYLTPKGWVTVVLIWTFAFIAFIIWHIYNL